MSLIRAFLFLVRLLLGLSSLIGLYYLLLPIGYMTQGSVSLSNLPLWYSFGLGFLVLYFLYCIVCCFGILRQKALLISGIGMNLILVLALASIYFQIRNDFMLVIAAYFAILWTTLYVLQTFIIAESQV
jgi:hypothetical protein